MEISFIILTWNSEQFIEQCLLSISKSCQKDEISNYEVIVIDNNSTDMTKEIIKNTTMGNAKRIELIELERNYGTTKTRNMGLQKSLGEYICVLDSDAEIKNINYNYIFSYLDENPDVGIVAPKLIYPNGDIQVSVKKFPTLSDKMKRLLKVFANRDLKHSDYYSDFPFNQLREVETAISAFWIFRRETISAVGLLDEKIFYSPEDVDYCLRVWKAGKKVVYCPFFEILHHTQQISHHKPFSKVSLSHFAGLLYYFWKHGYCFSRRKLPIIGD